MFNNVAIIASNLAIAHFWGLQAVGYLVASTLLGMGFHPVAAHFIAEHYIFVEGINLST
jgi:sphingolipid delta-4 desaturase